MRTPRQESQRTSPVTFVSAHPGPLVQIQGSSPLQLSNRGDHDRGRETHRRERRPDWRPSTINPPTTPSTNPSTNRCYPFVLLH
ncbi:MAG: hypothetical protein OER95_12525, partial [Acidimicrobiia bacterium]|nr:hypothetical protein [Acidimicrobiia bacterium]